MAHVDFDFKCPQCGNSDAYGDANTRNGTEIGSCLSSCGYHYRIDEDGNAHVYHGKGAYELRVRRGVHQRGVFAKQGSIADRRHAFRKAMKSPKVEYLAVTHKTGYRKWEWVVLKDERKPVFKVRATPIISLGDWPDNELPF